MARRLVRRMAIQSAGQDEWLSYTAVLLTQGRHRFYTLAMPSEVLARTTFVDRRQENPIDGFQRLLDRKRAEDIKKYIDSDFGTIPSSIILSAQPEAELEYTRKTRTIKFRNIPRAFLIIDGQHRVFGFHLSTTTLRVPVVIYNNLTRAEEATLFIDINTKQRPVPPELLLDIKRMAETETDVEALLRDVFDLFDKNERSPLFGMLSPSERRAGKISRVTFNAALKAILETFEESDAAYVYGVLSAYLHACMAGLRAYNAEESIANPTLFKALILLFPNVAERVADRHGSDFSTEHFGDVLANFFRRVKKSDLKRPGASHKNLYEKLRAALSSGFTIGRPG